VFEIEAYGRVLLAGLLLCLPGLLRYLFVWLPACLPAGHLCI
jgi:hypothetical protein